MYIIWYILTYSHILFVKVYHNMYILYYICTPKYNMEGLLVLHSSKWVRGRHIKNIHLCILNSKNIYLTNIKKDVVIRKRLSEFFILFGNNNRSEGTKWYFNYRPYLYICFLRMSQGFLSRINDFIHPINDTDTLQLFFWVLIKQGVISSGFCRL